MERTDSLAARFRALHQPGSPVVLFNIWDAGSARAVAGSGAQAIATGSAPVAAAHGFPDGEQMPLELALSNIKRIVSAVDLPVSMDLESGYGSSPGEVAETVRRALEAGAVGFNLEDQVIGGDGLYEVEAQCDRLTAARACGPQGEDRPFLNARTDLFLKTPAADHDADLLRQAIQRASAYQGAGADGFFAPGLVDKEAIRTLCEEVPMPVNVLALPTAPPLKELREVGVGRVSYGPVIYRAMLAWLAEQRQSILESD